MTFRSVDFFGGKAHEGFVNKALALFKNNDTMGNIIKGLARNSTYRLILTGHSLGAAVAGLLFIKLNVERWQPLRNREVSCVGFGCPPAFAPPENNHLVDAALSKTSWFVNRHDIIPFLSNESVNAFAETLKKVNASTGTMSMRDLARLFRNSKYIPETLVKVVEADSHELKPPESGKRLQIPGKRVFWMHDGKGNEDPGKLKVVCCDPAVLSSFAIRLSDQFLFDHMTPRYHKRIHGLLNQK